MGRRIDEDRLRELMIAYQAGAYGAFEGLYAVLVTPVRGWLVTMTRDGQRADDLSQETFLQIHRARHTYDPAYPVIPWVMAIARHVYLMDRRTASRRPRYVAEEHAPEGTVVADVERHIAGAPVRDALRHLTPERRAALLLHHVGGWTFRDIAQKLGIRETAAKLRSSRGMAQLRDALRGREDHE
jgi:RNA polymerase sigma factor (sigma-70 family)